jgi:hypothetical protein
VIVVGSWVTTPAGQQNPQPSFPGAPVGKAGEAIFAAVEGWGPLSDGRNAIEIGYNNRNRDQVIDVPIGPNNKIEPGGPDFGQPTHFEPGRAWGIFAIAVPKDFGTKSYTWTITANGTTTAVQLSMKPAYWIDFYKNAAKGNTPPVIKFAENGPEYSGPPVGVALNLNATVGQPLPLALWAKDAPNTYDPEEGLPDNLRSSNQARGRGRGGNDDAAAAAAARAARAGGAGGANFDVSAAQGRNPGGRGRGQGTPADVTVSWKVHRGDKPVKFADEAIRLEHYGDWTLWMPAKTTATFSAPGEYWLRAQVNDNSGDGGAGEQCCWTNAVVKVTVK